jgi:serine phosphatase RsbU (regulator of sigma subunit)
MAILIIHDGPPGQKGRRFSLEELPALIGRDSEAHISLPSPLVSRRHARILSREGEYLIEDLGSRNGVLINGQRITRPVPVHEGDKIRIVDFVLGLRQAAPANNLVDSDSNIREQVTVSAELYNQQSGHKLKVLLELSQELSRAVDKEALFEKLLDRLLDLFPRAERGVVVLYEQGKLVVQAQRSRARDTDFPISRTIIRQALEDGVGLLSEDIHQDERFAASATVQRVDSTSLLCVPLIGHNNRRLGALQLASGRAAEPFVSDDLHLLMTIGMQAAMVVEHLSLQEERVQQAQLRKELAMAREIQQSFLPTKFTPLAGGDYELYAVVYPAREVSGDLYDFFALDDGRLAFFAGDVSSKGMPAALFMVAVHALSRHLASGQSSPAATLSQLNTALNRDNETDMFVTLLHGIFDPRSGDTWLASGGHPRPLLRRNDGSISEIAMPTGLLLGVGERDLDIADTRVNLAVGDTLILYTDGVTEARAQGNGAMFGLDRLRQVLSGLRPQMTLEDCAERIRLAVELYTGSPSLHDDLTLLLLRRQ